MIFRHRKKKQASTGKLKDETYWEKLELPKPAKSSVTLKPRVDSNLKEEPHILHETELYCVRREATMLRIWLSSRGGDS